jgi:endonuclease/exonuclease/phosphatase (EEP) superfamily protein YafD
MVSMHELLQKTWVLVAVALVGCASNGPPVAGPALRVLTYNMNYGLAGDPQGLAVIDRTDADVVLLQETNTSWQLAIEARLSRRYPYRDWHRAPAAGGLGVLSKYPIVDRQIVPATRRGWFAAQRVTVRSPVGVVQFLNVHLRPALNHRGSLTPSAYIQTKPIRLNEVKAFSADLDPSVSAVIAGDFNEADGNPATQWLRSRGYVNALTQRQPFSSTWRWPLPLGQTLSARIDHVYGSSDLVPVETRVLAAGRSDHLPVLVSFKKAVR